MKIKTVLVSSITTTIAISLLLYRLNRPKSLVNSSINSERSIEFTKNTINSSNLKVGVNKEFLKQLNTILRICIPSFNTKTTLTLFFHTLFLFIRTYLSVVIARIDGILVKNLVFTNYDYKYIHSTRIK